MVWIHKLKGHRHVHRIRSSDVWAKIDFHLRRIAARPFENFDLPVEIDREKMRKGLCRFVAHNRIDLRGPRSTVVDIVPGSTEPSYKELPKQDRKNGNDHANSK